MTISRVPGYALLSNLDRQGTDLSITSGATLQYWDVSNFRIGINTDTPLQALHVNGNILAGNGHVYTGANLQFDIGSDTRLWRTGYFGNVSGTVITADQPFITNVGPLGNLTVLGSLTVANVNLGNLFVSGNLNAGNNRIINVADPITNTDAATKAYVDQQVVGTNLGNLIPLGTATDGNLTGANAAYQGFTTSTLVTDAIDILNSVAQNLFTNTFVRSVTFSANTTAGGAGQTILLTMVPQGNVNQYVISWGDGTANTTTSSSTATHTYATNVGTPFTVIVSATNTGGASPSNAADSIRTNYITIYGPDPALGFSTFRANISTTPLSGTSLYAIQGNAFYLQNTTTNTNTATVTWSINWGDGTYANVPNNSSAGGVLGPYANHTYLTNSSTSSFTVNLALLTDDIANPAILPRYTAQTVKVYANSISVPSSLNTKTLTFSGSVGTTPTLASGATDNTGGTTLAANASVSRTVATGTTLITTTGNVTTNYSYNANVGYLQAVVNGTVRGNVNMASQTTPVITGNLGVIGFSDFWLLTSAGASTTFASSTYYPGLYWGYTANVVSQGGSIPVGINRFGLNSSNGGIVANVEFVKDDVTSVPTVTVGNLAIKAPGTYRYISGVPYFNTGSPQLWLQDVTISSWIGQTWNNTANVVFVATSTNAEGTTGNIILANTHPYASLSNVSSPMLASGTPIAGTGNVSAYSIANLTLAINQASVRSIANVVVVATNVNGTSTAAQVTSKKVQVHTASQSGISEISITANASLGDGTYTSNGIRSSWFKSNIAFNPPYSNGLNYFTGNVYSESSDPGVAGTKEATVRWGVIKYDVSDFGNVYLPPGPNRSSDTGTQFFTFAFQRRVVSQFSLNIVAPSGVANVWIAAPGTTLDSTSGLNGWLRCDTTYAGAGKPGSVVGNGGNGSDGVAFTSGDKITANTALNGTFKMTLGTESLTNATNNVCLVRIALVSGQTISTLAVV